jgi:fatty acid desaturase
MGAGSADQLRRRFEQDGFVELRLRAWKVATNVVVLVSMAVALLLVVWFAPPFLAVAAFVFFVWFAVAVGALYAEQLASTCLAGCGTTAARRAARCCAGWTSSPTTATGPWCS